MLNLESREVLDKKVFENYILDDDNIKNMSNILIKLKAKIYPQKLAKLFNCQLDIDNFDDYEIYFLAKHFYTISKNEKKEDINPNKYFNNNEINKYEQMSDIDYTVEIDNHIIIHDVVEIQEGREWRSAKVSIKDLKSFMDKNLITYNPKTQRPSNKRVINGKVKEVISKNDQSIKEIKDLILKGEYFPPTIALNVLINGNEKFNYMNGTLGIASECDLLDGFHNFSAFIKALRVNPDIELYYKVDIYRVDENTARNFIFMRNKQNPFKMETESYYDTANVYNLVANDINIEGTNNLMKNKLGKEYNDVKLLEKYCTFETLANAIKDNFELDKKDVRKTRKIKLYLIDFFNEIIGSIFNEEFEDVKASRLKGSLATTNNMFYCYVALASVLYKQDDWQEKLYDILSQFNFDKKSEIWASKGMTMKDITGKQKSVLYNFFKSLYNEKSEVS